MMDIDPFPGTKHMRRDGKNPPKYILTHEQEAWLRKWHPCIENRVLQQMSGFSHSVLARFIKELGLKKDGEGFRQIKQRFSEHRKRLIKSERRRLMWGMKQQTKIYVALKPYNFAQLSCRAHALEKGYVLSTDYKEGSPYRWIIYYDNDTPRDEVFERNCNKNGFMVKEWKED